MLGLNRLSSEVEKRKLMFLHTILNMSTKSITQKVFIRKYIMFIENCNSVKLGFIPDLQYIINDFIIDPCLLPSKFKWKQTVKSAIKTKETVLWRDRINSDTDFVYFKKLQTDIKPALLYTISKDQSYLQTALLIAKLWSRSIDLERKTCAYCGSIYEDFIAHIISTCLISSDKRTKFYQDISVLTNIYFAQQLK